MKNESFNNPPTKGMPRFVQIDDWIFEIKTVRALRVDKYGKPYSAIANLTVNGDTAYVDGLLTQEEAFSRKDFQTFERFCQQMQVKQMNYDRFKNDRLISECVDINPVKQQEILQLVR
jgi:hypothetical protein